MTAPGHPDRGRARPRADGRPPGSGDRGSTSLAVVLLVPVFVVLLFAAVQATLWTHARTRTRVAAKTAAVAVARRQASAGDARSTALANLDGADLADVRIAIDTGAGLVVVTITADAPGILLGTSRSISVTEAVAVEEIVPR